MHLHEVGEYAQLDVGQYAAGLHGGGGAVSCASAGEAASGADLGGSSNYSNEIFED